MCRECWYIDFVYAGMLFYCPAMVRQVFVVMKWLISFDVTEIHCIMVHHLYEAGWCTRQVMHNPCNESYNNKLETAAV